jgi:hypothetical protein
LKIPFKYLLIALVLLVAGIIYSSLSQPGINDLPGNFTEVASYRNENNTGPVQRIYAVTVSDTLWSEMEAYGNFMPYSKLGSTTVYFFHESQLFPAKLVPGDPNFPPDFNVYCLARYEKSSMGAISLTRYPFQ